MGSNSWKDGLENKGIQMEDRGYIVQGSGENGIKGKKVKIRT